MISHRSYNTEPGFSPDFYLVHDFLVRLNQPVVVAAGFPWGRWEWMFCRHTFSDADLPRIGIWIDNDAMVALATFEDHPGSAYLLVLPQYAFLRSEMLAYARERLGHNGEVKVLIRDGDRAFEELAARQGLNPTTENEQTSVISLRETRLSYDLPAGYRIVSLADEFDLIKYNRVLWRGFDHPGEASESRATLEGRRQELSGPHAQLSLNIAVAAPDGAFVSYCGTWHLPASDYVLVEPVATDPDYRRMGLGRAAVLEAISRCGSLGARQAYVGSSQQFYSSLGFRLGVTDRWWRSW